MPWAATISEHSRKNTKAPGYQAGAFTTGIPALKRRLRSGEEILPQVNKKFTWAERRAEGKGVEP